MFEPDPLQPTTDAERKKCTKEVEGEYADDYRRATADAREFLETTPSAVGLQAGVGAVAILGGQAHLNLHVDIANPSNTGLYLTLSGSAGLEVEADIA